MYNDYFSKTVFDVAMSSLICTSVICLFFGSFALAQQPTTAIIGPAPSSGAVIQAAPSPTPVGSPVSVPTPAPTSTPTPPEKLAGTVVAYFSPQGKTQFEIKVKPIFAKQTSSCSNCHIVDYTPYNEKGEYAPEKLESVIKQLPENVKILFFDFNLKRGSFSESLMALLNQDASNGPLVVASAGTPAPQEPSRPLVKTVFGQVTNALIIGDLEDRDRLTRSGFFGPEMYTAIRPPKDLQGQSGIGPALFASKFAAQYHRRSAKDWLSFFKTKKERNRKIWLELGDLFY